MKKTINKFLTVVLLAGSSILYAQDAPPPQAPAVAEDNAEVPINKRGVRIIPAGGDFGLGFDLVQFAKSLGNDFDETQQSIFGKRFLGSPGDPYNSLKAIRGRITINNHKTVALRNTIDDSQTLPDTSVTVIDRKTIKAKSFELAAGYEWRRGHRRLYGIYGGEVVLNLTSASSDYEYGNQMSSGNQTPTSATNFIGRSQPAPVSKRTISEKASPSAGIGVNAIVGAEFFFAPRISASAEFSLGIMFTNYFDSAKTAETWDKQNNSVLTLRSTYAAGNNLSLTTGLYRGTINLFFYF